MFNSCNLPAVHTYDDDDDDSAVHLQISWYILFLLNEKKPSFKFIVLKKNPKHTAHTHNNFDLLNS